FAAVPGAIRGSIPPVIGWVAAGGGLTDTGAIILFGILFLWQMPHFWALALRYRGDYASGGFPMVSDVVGVEGTARLILLYASGLTAWSLAAPTFGVGGPISFALAALLGGRLMWLAVKFAREPHDQRGWLSLFLFSNFYLLLLFAGMVAERLLSHLLLCGSGLGGGTFAILKRSCTHEHLRRRHRIRGACHGSGVCRSRERRRLRGQGPRQDCRPQGGAPAHLRARPRRDGPSQRGGQPPQLHE